MMSKIWWFLLAVVVALAVTAIFNFALALRLLALALTALGFLGVLLKIVTFKRARRLTATSLFISMALSVSVLGIYLFVLGVTLPIMLFLLGFISGTWVGWLWAGPEQLLQEAGEIKSRGTWLSLLVWAVIFLTTQFLTVATGQAPLAMVVLMLLGTGIAVGYSLRQLGRYFRLRRMPS